MMRKKVTELLGCAILSKKMPERKKSRTNFRYFCIFGMIFGVKERMKRL